MFTYFIYIVAAIALLLSACKSKQKTKQALFKAWKAFENILPQLLAVLCIIGMMLSILNPEVITTLIGKESGWLGIALGVIVGAVTLIPGFVAFPLAAALLEGGAGVAQIAGFISSLMMVGVVTLPMEIKTFGKQIAYRRNALAFAFSVVVALVMGGLLG